MKRGIAELMEATLEEITGGAMIYNPKRWVPNFGDVLGNKNFPVRQGFREMSPSELVKNIVGII